MKPIPIKWQNHPECSDICGRIKDHEVFVIKEKLGKNKIKFYQLFSAMMPNNVFYRSTNLRNLEEFSSIELAQQKADSLWNEYVNELIVK